LPARSILEVIEADAPIEKNYVAGYDACRFIQAIVQAHEA
jgi:hypothetical protein